MKKIYTTIAIFLLANTLHAQFVYDYVKAADNYYNKGDYASAAEYYEKYLAGSKDSGKKEFNPYSPPTSSSKKAAATSPGRHENAVYRLAESYRMLNFPSKAAPNYKLALEQNPALFPLASYYYATQTRALGQYAEAEKFFKSFLAVYTTDDEYRKNAERELKNLEFIQAQLSKKGYQILYGKESASNAE